MTENKELPQSMEDVNIRLEELILLYKSHKISKDEIEEHNMLVDNPYGFPEPYVETDPNEPPMYYIPGAYAVPIIRYKKILTDHNEIKERLAVLYKIFKNTNEDMNDDELEEYNILSYYLPQVDGHPKEYLIRGAGSIPIIRSKEGIEKLKETLRNI